MKDIPGFEGLYAATRDGKIWSYPKARYINGRFLKPSKNPDGYLNVILSISTNNYVAKKVHRLVALAWIPNNRNLTDINHKNGIKTDNRLENLEWCTRSDNLKHAFKLGLSNKKGSKNSMAKLNELLVLQIRKEREIMNISYIDLSIKYGLAKSSIKDIVHRRRWAHV